MYLHRSGDLVHIRLRANRPPKQVINAVVDVVHPRHEVVLRVAVAVRPDGALQAPRAVREVLAVGAPDRDVALAGVVGREDVHVQVARALLVPVVGPARGVGVRVIDHALVLVLVEAVLWALGWEPLFLLKGVSVE